MPGQEDIRHQGVHGANVPLLKRSGYTQAPRKNMLQHQPMMYAVPHTTLRRLGLPRHVESGGVCTEDRSQIQHRSYPERGASGRSIPRVPPQIDPGRHYPRRTANAGTPCVVDVLILMDQPPLHRACASANAALARDKCPSTNGAKLYYW